MGWILCRASVSVVGLSASAGHSSGVAPFPGVEDDSLPERSRRRSVIFKRRHILAGGERNPRKGPWPAGPAGTVQAERPQKPPPLQARRAPQALSVTKSGCDRVIHSHTSPPKPSCFRSSRAGVGKLARLARSAAPPGHADGSSRQESSRRCAPRAARAHTIPVPFRLRCSRPRALPRGEGTRSGMRAPRAPGRQPGRWPRAGAGASAVLAGRIPNPRRMPAQLGPRVARWGGGARGA